MRLSDLFGVRELETAITAGHVTRKAHPSLPISILTYTRTCQYERAWTAVTLRCRGLVAEDGTGEIVAWPFPKFFNVPEHSLGHDHARALPDEPFEVYDKIDGSLGIVFHYDRRWRVASKGSFTSEQARWAQRRLDERSTGGLVPGGTYLAEIVYPGNRIVVDYGDRHDLVLLGAYDADGRERPLGSVAHEWAGIGTVVRRWPAPPLAELLRLAAADTRPDGRPTTGLAEEGYVVRYASGLRAKAKLAEYVRLHEILTGVSERDIWRRLGLQRYAGRPPKLVAKALGCPVAEVTALAADGKGPLDALLERVPDEFDQWVRGVAARLEREHAARTARATAEYAAIAHLGADRAEFARAARRIGDSSVRACMFLILDGRPTGLHLWHAVKPEGAAPFVADDER
ncbi:T4 RnlA family RNA ligase [Streptomyces sp. NBC_01007]|nr:T4 RnlA family RNA ligase [Streptomyces sp. NBC_01007]